MIHALKGMHKTFDKCFADIGNLESFLKLEIQKMVDRIETTDVALQNQEAANACMEREHRADMASVAAVEKQIEIALKQMEDHKKKVFDRLEEVVQK